MRRTGSIKIGGGSRMSEHVLNCALALLHSAARGPGTPGGERALWTDACRTFFLTAVGHAARPQSSDLEVPWKSSGAFHSLSFSLCQFAETMRGFLLWLKTAPAPVTFSYVHAWCFCCARSNGESGFRSRWLGE